MALRRWKWSDAKAFLEEVFSRLGELDSGASEGQPVEALVEVAYGTGRWPLVAYFRSQEGGLEVLAWRGLGEEMLRRLATNLSAGSSWPDVHRSGECACLQVEAWQELEEGIRAALGERDIRYLGVWRTAFREEADAVFLVGCPGPDEPCEEELTCLGMALRLLELRLRLARLGAGGEAELLRSQAKYKVLFESAGDGIFLMEGTRFVDCNERAAELFGGTRQQLIGMEPYALSPHRQPDGRLSKEKAIEKIRAAHREPQRFSWRHRRLDGREFDAEVTLNRVDLDGQPHLLAVVRDVTDQRIAQGALRLANHRLRVIGEFQRALLRLEDPVACADEALERLSELVDVPTLAAVEYDDIRDECRVLSIRVDGRVLHPGSAVRLSPDQVRAMEQGDVVWLEGIDRLRAEGAVPEVGRHDRALLVPMLASGRWVGFLGLGLTADTKVDAEELALVADVAAQLALAIRNARLSEDMASQRLALEALVRQRTAELERRMAEVDRLNRDMEVLVEDLRETNRRLERALRSLQEANEDLEAFASSISHDLRAPVRTMYGFAEALLEDYGESMPEQARERLRTIVAAADRLTGMIEGLLEYARISRATATLGPVPLEPLVREALEGVAEDVRARDAEVALAGPMPRVVGHPQVVVQVLTNLLSNAVKFVPPGRRPRVRLWVEEREDWVWIHVEDNGIGIPDADRHRIFGVFERLHPDAAYPGTGIGLALVKRGVERLGGKLEVRSFVDKGSRFSIALKKARERVSSYG